ncbi:MAG: flavin reductase family protein [Bacteroidetes bacterium]|nr:MAG: flavin reductase family protein [Bacteroidota bacterium]
MKEINPETYGNPQLFKLLLEGVAPRPIAFASTIDKDGNPNLSPFSFYNAFGVNPTTLIFSPSRRGRDNTTKHTLDNLREVPEVVLNAVSYSMVHQMSLSSTEYAKGVNEFEKAGFTAIESVKVKPFRVKESPLQFECKVREIIEISGKPGSGNLVVCEILCIHLDENILDVKGGIDPDKIDLVGRMGGDYYVRTSGDAKFTIPKPLTTLGIGVDGLPESIRLSEYLTGNELGQLGNIEQLPGSDEIQGLKENKKLIKLASNTLALHSYAKSLIKTGDVYQALQVLMMTEY